MNVETESLLQNEEYLVQIPSPQNRTVHLLNVPVTFNRKHTCKLVFYLLGIVASIIFVIWIGWWYFINQTPRVRGIVLMISDGFGPASETMARNYYQKIYNKSVDFQLPLDTILVGSSRTRSASALVTDSAAGATAFSCALKTYNGAIGVDPNEIPCGTVLEAAKDVGMFTGLVVTSRITHATPASFSAHVSSRASEEDIALQQIGHYPLGRNVDLMFGGGKCLFEKSCRTDGKDVFQMAGEYGWNIVSDLNKTSIPCIALFSQDHMPYEIDRTKDLPSLAEMSSRALSLLNRKSLETGRGFFLMIEGSRIDMSAHTNDPATHIHEIIAYNNAIQAVKDFVSANKDVMMISVSDHETGGLSVATQLNATYPVYDWYPFALKNISNSAEHLARKITSYNQSETKIKYIIDTLANSGIEITNQQASNLSKESNQILLENMIGKIASDKAEVGWATHGHSAVDVNLYAYGRNSHLLRGNHENTDIGKFIVEQFGLDLAKITKKLEGTWLGKHPVIEHDPKMVIRRR